MFLATSGLLRRAGGPCQSGFGSRQGGGVNPPDPGRSGRGGLTPLLLHLPPRRPALSLPYVFLMHEDAVRAGERALAYLRQLPPYLHLDALTGTQN